MHSRVGDRHAVVLLVQRLHAVQDVDRLRERRLVHVNGLKPALEGHVLLDVLAVLVQSRRADALDLSASKCGLEDIGSVDSTFRRAGADESVKLVDEQHDLTTRPDLVEDFLESLFELAAVLGAGDQGAHVEGQHALVLKRLRNVTHVDLLRQTLSDRGLAHAGLADEGRVVLGSAAQDLNHALDLHLAPYDRIQLVPARELGEVAAELVEQRRLGWLLRSRLRLCLRARVVEQALDLGPDLFERGAQVLEDMSGDAFALDQQPQQEVLGADIVVAHPACFFEGDLDHLLDARRRDDLLDDDPLIATEDRLDRLANLADLHAKVVQNLGGEALAFTEKTQK